MLKKVQSMRKRTPSQENLTGNLTTDMENRMISKDSKSFSKRFGSGRMIGVFAVLKSSVPTRTRSLDRLESLPRDIPAGSLAVYVGPERRRFVISTKCLSHQLFKSLLKKCEEEFGFHHQGGLTISTCDPVLFEHLVWLIGSKNPTAKTVQLEDLVEFCPS